MSDQFQMLIVVFVCLTLCLQCTVQVKLELGHRAQLRKKVTTEGFTHDWMVFVRGPETGDIQHFVEKVVFRLHESFPKPKRGGSDKTPSQQQHLLVCKHTRTWLKLVL